jgi:hypothetical protein
MRLACRRPWDPAGSGIVAVCHCSCRNLYLIGTARQGLRYTPQFDIQAGIDRAMPWCIHTFNTAFFV